MEKRKMISPQLEKWIICDKNEEAVRYHCQYGDSYWIPKSLIEQLQSEALEQGKSQGRFLAIREIDEIEKKARADERKIAQDTLKHQMELKPTSFRAGE